MDTDGIFSKAAVSTQWVRTNMGPRTEVSHGGYVWTVELPSSGEGVATINHRYGPGGVEILDLHATWAQTIRIVEASQSALRPPCGETWEALLEDQLIGRFPSDKEAKSVVDGLLRETYPRDGIRWSCWCGGDENCPDCADGRPDVQLAYRMSPGALPYLTRYSVERRA